MNNKNSFIRTEARATLSGRWGIAIILYFIYTLFNGAALVFNPVINPMLHPAMSPIWTILITTPIAYSLSICYLRIARRESVEISNLFDAFCNYMSVLSTMLLMTIYTLLWSLLFIVPGVIKSYSYAMTPYLLYDRGLTNDAAIDESMRMMRGHKMNLFLMDLGFYALTLLSLLTLGIALLWVIPYWLTARAKFYQNIISEI